MCCWSLLACTNTGRKKKVGEDVKSQFEAGVGQMLEISLLENIFFSDVLQRCWFLHILYISPSFKQYRWFEGGY